MDVTIQTEHSSSESAPEGVALQGDTVEGALSGALDSGPSSSSRIHDKHGHLQRNHGIEEQHGSEAVQGTSNSQPAETPQSHSHRSSSAIDISSPLTELTIHGRANQELLTETSESSSQVKAWNPIFLGRTTLLIFIALFGAMTVALALLYHFSQLHNGISTQLSKNHYSWKYGPTSCKLLLSLKGTN